VTGQYQAAATAAEDLIRNRPALSRWHPDYADEFAEFLTLEAPFRR
jgi:hypothetical protein